MDAAKALDKCVKLRSEYIHVEFGGDYYAEREGNTLRLFFECSDGAEDWRSNFNFFAIPRKPYKNMRSLWFCHRGFLKVFKAIEPYIKDLICDPSVTRIETVGYSHGAALALLCCEYCMFNRPDAEVEGAGFGCPRVIWGPVPKEVKQRLASFKVYRNRNDIVTYLPPILFGYRHVSPVIHIGKRSPVIDHYSEEYTFSLKKERICQ